MRVLAWEALALAVGSAIAIATPRAEANPDQVNGCRLASPEEISGGAGVTVTRAVDRGTSGCTYDNGQDASRTETSVRVDTLEASAYDLDVAKWSANADVDDVSELGVDAKYLVFQHQGVRTAVLIVKADAAHAFTVDIFPTTGRASAIAVAKLLLPRVQNGS
jgi:hypothetical protein